jgi:CLASP N terminal
MYVSFYLFVCVCVCVCVFQRHFSLSLALNLSLSHTLPPPSLPPPPPPTAIVKIKQAVTNLYTYIREVGVRENDRFVVRLLDAYCDVLLVHSNPKICLNSLRCLSQMVDVIAVVPDVHFHNVVDKLAERLGDRQQTVRDHALDVILKLMGSADPASVFDRLRSATRARNAHVREHYLICYVGAVETYGPSALSPGALLPDVVRLVSDKHANVREAAIQCIECMYHHVGQPLIDSLRTQFDIPARLIAPIIERCTSMEVVPEAERVPFELSTFAQLAAKRRRSVSRKSTRRSGASYASGSKTPRARGSRSIGSRSGSHTPTSASGSHTPRSTSSTRSGRSRSRRNLRKAKSKPVSRTISKPGSRGGSRPLSPRAPRSGSHTPRSAASRSTSTNNTMSARRTRRQSIAGMADNMQLMLHDDVKAVQLPSDRMERELSRRVDEICNTFNTGTWKQRTQGLRDLASLVMGNAINAPNWMAELKKLKVPLTGQVTELRSSVVKEACALLVYMSERMGDRFAPLADHFVPILLQLTYVTVMIISYSGDAAIKGILQHTQIARAIKQILIGCEQTSNDSLRANCSDYLLVLLEAQPENRFIQKYLMRMAETIASLLVDRSETVRTVARQCYWAFRNVPEGKAIAEAMAAEFSDKTHALVFDEANEYEENMRRRTMARSSSAITDALLAAGVATEDVAPDAAPLRRSQTARPAKSSRNLSRRKQPIKRSESDLLQVPQQSSRFVNRSAKGSKTPRFDSTGGRRGGSPRRKKSSRNLQRQSSSDDLDVTLNWPSERLGSTKSRRELNDMAATAELDKLEEMAELSDVMWPSEQQEARERKSQTMRAAKSSRLLGTHKSAKQRVQKSRRKSMTNDSISSNYSQSSADNSERSSTSTANVRSRLKPLSTKQLDKEVSRSAGTSPPSRVPRSRSRNTLGSAEPIKMSGGYTGVSSSSKRRTAPAGSVRDALARANKKQGQRSDRDVPGLNLSGAQAADYDSDDNDTDSDDMKSRSRSASMMSNVSADSPVNQTLLLPGSHKNAVEVSLSEGRAANPATRARAFARFQNLFRDSAAVADIIVNLPEIVLLLKEAVVDENMKVSQKALATIIDLMDCVKLKLIEQLPTMLPNVFARLTDKRPIIRQLANSVLVKLSHTYGAESLYPPIASVLEIRNARVRGGALEFLHHLLTQTGSSSPSQRVSSPITTGFFSEQANIRHVIHRLAPFTTSLKNIRLRDLAVSTLVLLIERCEASVVYRELLGLPREWVQKVIPPLEKYVPDLRQQLAQHSFDGDSQDFAVIPASPSANGSVRRKHGGNRSEISYMEDMEESMSADPESQQSSAADESSVLNTSGSLHDQLDNAMEEMKSAVEEADALTVDLDVEGLANDLSQSESRPEALRKLITIAKTQPVPLQTHFDVLFIALLECLTDDSTSVKHMGVDGMHHLVNACKADFTAGTYAEMLTIHLLDLYRTSPKNTQLATDKCLADLALCANPGSLYSVLVTTAETEKKADSGEAMFVLHASLRMLSKLLERISRTDLDVALERMCPCLADCMSNPNAMIRKDVVSCFVALYTVMGEDLMPHLDMLTTSQLKLVKIYITRATGSHVAPESSLR